MKRCIAFLAVGLALSAQRSFAREPQAPPSPVLDDAAPKSQAMTTNHRGNSVFVGHYGEILELSYGWTAEAELRGDIEAIYIHRKSHDEFGQKPFQPKKSEFKAENFAPKGLIELIVIPKKTPGGMRSLKAMRHAKEKELANSGAEYKFSDVTNDFHWPIGTFHVEVRRPHTLVQTYAESPREFYILTFGGDLNPGDFGLTKDRILDFRYAGINISESLGKYLLSVRKPTFSESIFRPEPRDSNSFSMPFGLQRLRITLGAFGLISLSIALWPGTSPKLRRARLFAWSLFAFASLMALTAFFSVFIPVYFGDVIWRQSATAGLIPICLAPLFSWIAAKRLGSVHAKRVLLSVGALSILLALDMMQGSRLDSAKSGDILAYESTLLLFTLGLAFGTVFSLAFGPLPKKGEFR